MYKAIVCVVVLLSIVCVQAQQAPYYYNDGDNPTIPLVTEVGQSSFTSNSVSNTWTGIYTTTAGVYIADSGRGVINFYSNPVSAGAAPSLTFGRFTASTTNVLSVAVDVNGNVYVTDSNANSLYYFRAPITSASQPTLLLSNSRPLWGAAISNPNQVTINPINQHVLLVDQSNNRVLEFPANYNDARTFPLRVYGAADYSANINNCRNTATVSCFLTPTSVSIDSYNGVWVAAQSLNAASILFYFFPNTTGGTGSSYSFAYSNTNAWTPITSIAWNVNSTYLAIAGTSPNDNSGTVYFASPSFTNGRAAAQGGYLNYVGSNINAAPDATSGSFSQIYSLAWDTVNPGFFWATDLGQSRATLQSPTGLAATASSTPTASAVSPTSAASASASTPASASASSVASASSAASASASTAASASSAASASGSTPASASGSSVASASGSTPTSASGSPVASATTAASQSAAASVAASGTTGPSQSAPVASQSASAAISPSASFIAPSVTNAAVSPSASAAVASTTNAPSGTNPNSVSQSAPVASQSAPVASQSAAVASQSAPVASQSAAVASQSAAVASQSASAVTASASFIAVSTVSSAPSSVSPVAGSGSPSSVVSASPSPNTSGGGGGGNSAASMSASLSASLSRSLSLSISASRSRSASPSSCPGTTPSPSGSCGCSGSGSGKKDSSTTINFYFKDIINSA